MNHTSETAYSIGETGQRSVTIMRVVMLTIGCCCTCGGEEPQWFLGENHNGMWRHVMTEINIARGGSGASVVDNREALIEGHRVLYTTAARESGVGRNTLHHLSSEHHCGLTCSLVGIIHTTQRTTIT